MARRRALMGHRPAEPVEQLRLDRAIELVRKFVAERVLCHSIRTRMVVRIEWDGAVPRAVQYTFYPLDRVLSESDVRKVPQPAPRISPGDLWSAIDGCLGPGWHGRALSGEDGKEIDSLALLCLGRKWRETMSRVKETPAWYRAGVQESWGLAEASVGPAARFGADGAGAGDKDPEPMIPPVRLAEHAGQLSTASASASSPFSSSSSSSGACASATTSPSPASIAESDHRPSAHSPQLLQPASGSTYGLPPTWGRQVRGGAVGGSSPGLGDKRKRSELRDECDDRADEGDAMAAPSDTASHSSYMEHSSHGTGMRVVLSRIDGQAKRLRVEMQAAQRKGRPASDALYASGSTRWVGTAGAHAAATTVRVGVEGGGGTQQQASMEGGDDGLGDDLGSIEPGELQGDAPLNIPPDMLRLAKGSSGSSSASAAFESRGVLRVCDLSRFAEEFEKADAPKGGPLREFEKWVQGRIGGGDR